MALAAVCLDVEQLPAVLVEIGPTCRRCGVDGVGEPALVPDAAGAQHRVELGLLPGRYRRISKGQFDAHTVEWLLRNAVDGRGRGDVEQVVDRRGDVAD